MTPKQLGGLCALVFTVVGILLILIAIKEIKWLRKVDAESIKSLAFGSLLTGVSAFIGAFLFDII